MITEGMRIIYTTCQGVNISTIQRFSNFFIKLSIQFQNPYRINLHVNEGFIYFSPSMACFPNINDITTILKIYWEMIKTCLQAFGVDLNRIWAQKTNFLGSVVKWVAPDQVGRAPQVGSAHSILHWLWRSSGSRPSSGSHPFQVGHAPSKHCLELWKLAYGLQKLDFDLCLADFWQMSLFVMFYTWR